MINKKLLVTALVAGTLGLASCGTPTPTPTPSTSDTTPSTSTVAPVSRIEIKKIETTPVVGQKLDLDEYVVIHGGAGVNDFTAEYTGELASLEGHVLTILKEGAITVKIKAGTKSASLRMTAMSKTKAKYHELTKSVTNKYRTDSVNVSETGEITIPSDGDFLIKNPNYSYLSRWGYDEATQTTTPGGFIKSGKGNTFMFDAKGKDATDLVVAPGKQSSFENYFINMAYNLPAEILTTAYDTESGEEVGLTLSADVASNFPDYFANYVEEFCMINLALSLNDKYGFLSVEFVLIEDMIMLAPLAFAVSDTAQTPQLVGWYMLNTNEEESAVATLDAYVASNQEPAKPFDATPIKNDLTVAKEAANYTQTTRWTLLDTKTGEELKGSASGSYLEVNSLIDPTNMIYHAITGTNGEKQVMGFTLKDNKVYSLSGTEDNVTATLQEGITWGQVVSSATIKDLNLDSLVDDANIKQLVTNEGTTTAMFDGNGIETTFLKGLFNAAMTLNEFQFTYDSLTDLGLLSHLDILTTTNQTAANLIVVYPYYADEANKDAKITCFIDYKDYGTTVLPEQTAFHF